MNIQDKYKQYRPVASNGDIVVWHGTGFMAKAEQYFTRGYYNHVGIVYESLGRLFTIDANAPGVHPAFLSDRISVYNDFAIIRLNRSPESILTALQTVMDKAATAKGVKYNFLRLLRIAINDTFHVDPKWLDQKNRDICSQFVQLYTTALGMGCFSIEKLPLIVPQDFVRCLYPLDGQVLFDQKTG